MLDPVIAPSTCSVVAISTAPSISTTSKFVVPSTSTSPDISNDTAVTEDLNIAAPSADISKVNAVISELPSVPLNIISVSPA